MKDKIKNRQKKVKATFNGFEFDMPLETAQKVLRLQKMFKEQKSNPLPMKTTDYCSCSFVIIMRGKDNKAYCSECKKLVNER